MKSNGESSDCFSYQYLALFKTINRICLGRGTEILCCKIQHIKQIKKRLYLSLYDFFQFYFAKDMFAEITDVLKSRRLKHYAYVRLYCSKYNLQFKRFKQYLY